MPMPTLGVRCPVCGAVPGRSCVKISASARSWTIGPDGAMAGEWKKHPHPERVSVNHGDR